MNSSKVYTLLFFIFISGFILTIIPLPFTWNWYRPAWLILFICFWDLVLPGCIGVWIAWFIGLLLDLMLGNLLGSHALAFATIAYLWNILQRRIRYLLLWQQGLFVALMVFIAQVIIFIFQGLVGNLIIDIRFFAPVLSSLICWPWVYYILHRIQKRYRIYGSRLSP